MDIDRITGDLKLAFPIKYEQRAVTRAENEPDERWERRKNNTENVPTLWAYHVSISREVFEANYRIISAANMTMFSKGLGFAAESGPIIGTFSLRDAARQDAIENGRPIEGDPAAPILTEIKRLTTILAPSPTGYESLPVDIALARGVIDTEDWREAESSLVFFTCGSWMTRRERRSMKRIALASILRGSMTSLGFTEFAAGLATSTKPATSAAPVASLVPS